MMLLRRGVQQLAAAAGAEQGVLAFAQQLSDRLSSSLTAGSSNPSRIQQIHLYSTQQTPAQGANPPYVPWTPTKDLAKRKVYRKRMRFLMQSLEAERVEAVQAQRPLPNFQAGDILEVTVRVPENEGKTYTYRGVCIARANKSIRSTFTLYNVFPDVGGFVQHFPLFMPDLVGIKVTGRVARTRPRSKHYYLLEDNYREQCMLQNNVDPPKQ